MTSPPGCPHFVSVPQPPTGGRAAGKVLLKAPGSVTQTAAGTVTAQGLALSAGNPLSFALANDVATLAPVHGPPVPWSTFEAALGALSREAR